MKKIIGIIIIAFILLVGNGILFLSPKFAPKTYVVLAKYEQAVQYKYRSSQETFIRVRYDNGEEETKSFSDPFVAESYIVGNTYQTQFDYVESLRFLPAYIEFPVFLVNAVTIAVIGTSVIFGFIGGMFWLFS